MVLCWLHYYGFLLWKSAKKVWLYTAATVIIAYDYSNKASALLCCVLAALTCSWIVNQIYIYFRFLYNY